MVRSLKPYKNDMILIVENYTGDMVFIKCFGTPILFLNSYEDANELLDRRSSKYSSRPTLVMAKELYVYMKMQRYIAA